MSIGETIDRIETELDRDRQALAAALSDLRASMTLRGLAAQAVETAAAHPVPAAAAAAGLGLMTWRKIQPDTPAAPPRPAEPPAWVAEADALRARAAGMLEQVDMALRNGQGPAADLRARRQEILAALTADVRAALSRGLEGSSEAERARTLAAREADYAVHLGISRTPERAAERSSSGTPLVFAGVVAALGAAAALLMPRTELETRLWGESRDTVLAELARFAKAEAHRGGFLAHALVALLDSRR